MDLMTGDIVHWESYLSQSKINFEAKMSAPPPSRQLQKDFIFLQTLGKGKFSSVVVAKSAAENNYYTVKVMEKSRIVELKLVQQVLNEKKLLTAINFPFIIHMDHFYKGNSYIYFVLPFMSGGELSSYIQVKGGFHERISMFYASQILLALEYLHFLEIVYRDLEPANVLIAEDGYLKIIDLSYSKVIRMWTYSLCGTPDYIAPEVILSRGYTFYVDWWSFGVLIYEMCAGYSPFASDDTMHTYELILAGSYQMVQTFSDDLKDLLCNLLQVSVDKRLGCKKGGVRALKNHEWFRCISWLDILNKKISAPFRPRVEGPGDTSNFPAETEFTTPDSLIEEYAEEFKDF